MALIKNISRKKNHHVSTLTIGYLWTKYGESLFFIMCHEFSTRLDLSAQSLLNINPDKSRNNSAATVKMVKDLEAKLGPYTKNNEHK